MTKSEILRFSFTSLTSLAILLTVLAPVVSYLHTISAKADVVASSDENTQQSKTITITEEEEQPFYLCLTKSRNTTPVRKRSHQYYLMITTGYSVGIQLPPPELLT